MFKNKSGEFIIKAKEIHGNKYDYSETNYINARTKVGIICKKHGTFLQLPNDHLNGHGCPICGGTKKMNTDEFVKRLKEKFQDKYDYSKVNYVNSTTKICITCPIHGDFYQLPSLILKCNGCPKCNKKHHYTTEEFIAKSKEIHGEKYDYSKVNYINNRSKVIITCKIHGDFEQIPNKHLQGQGCPKCALEKRSKNKTLTKEQFISKCNKKNVNNICFDKTNYVNEKTISTFVCPIHGEFKMRPYDVLSGHGCPTCGKQKSKGEEEIANFIKSLNMDFIQRDRTILNGEELDIYIPSKKIAIEYNGLRWHSELYLKDKNYHLNKTLKCEKQGIRLIQIFEDEFLNNKTLVFDKIATLLHKNKDKEKIGARKSNIRIIKNDIAKPFLDKNHIQGYTNSSIHIAAYINDNTIVAVMSFKRIKESDYELVRFATNINYICQGFASKLLKYFIKNYNPNYIKSFLDRRYGWKNNNMYEKIGFKFDGYTRPDYRYYNGVNCIRYHKFNYRKSILSKKYNLPLSMTETEMAKEIKVYKIYDCGLIRYVWKKEK